jgi:uncharacterized membrane protein YgcG
MIARTLAVACTVLALGSPAPAQETKAAAEQAPAQEKAPTQVPAQAADPAAPDAQATTFSKEHLEQIVAPIALYPDALLTQILMAATYPLEIVEAARWVQKNPKITGDKLEAALAKETWDPSVKSLCGFNDVLKRMNDNLDWTQDLGDAFLGQQAELMDTVQHMRRKAYDAGNLKSGKELTVTEQADKIIIIEAAQPEVIYVPTYYPTAVYGSWGYPYYYYPPMYPPPPAGGVWFGFAAGVFWGAAIWGGCSWGWGHTEVDIDIDKQNNFIDRTEGSPRRDQVKDRARSKDTAGNRAGNKGGWQHNPEHRKGVGYKDGKTAQKYGGGTGSTRVSKDQARGYGERASQGPGAARTGAAPRDASRTQPSARTQPASGSNRASTGSSSRAGTSSTRASGQKSGSFSGSRSPSLDRASSSRGSSSRGSMGSRGGGGRGGGGRR